MPTNINAIARTSSGRLAETLSADLADSIVNDRVLHGDFASFEDLKKRIHGLGPVKIKKLKEAGFIVAPTARNARAVKDAHAVAEGDDGDRLPGLRQPVDKMAEATWRRRGNTDQFSGLRRTEVVKLYPENDHIWECQLLDQANFEASVGQGVAARTRGVQSALRSVVNGTTNLNVTTRDINQKKKAPITSWLRQQEQSLEDAAHDSKAGRALIDAGHWTRIETAIVRTYDDMAKEQDLLRDAASKRHVGRVLDSMNGMMTRMNIE